MSKNGTLVPRTHRTATLQEMQIAAPQPSGVGAMAEKLLLAAFDGIKEGDMTDIVKGVVEKAKAGDVKALKFVMDFIGKAGAPPPPPRVVYIHAPAAAESPDDDDAETPLPTKLPDPPHVQTLRRFAAKILAADGQTATAGLAGQLGMTDAELCHVMKHEWFESGNGYWSLTPAGRQANG